MPDRITHLTTVRPIVDAQASPTQEMRSWAQLVTELMPIVGSGSPEGVILGKQGVSFIDEDASSGSVLYKKQKTDIAGDRSKGWVLIG